MFPPSRIVCLTEETVETLYLLGQQDGVVGISGYVVLPPEARREKPRVSAFTSANIDKIAAREESMSELNRRHLLTMLGAGLTIAPSAFATSLSQDITQRLAQARQDGKVTGLHTLLVSQGGRLVFEHYGQGGDEAESRGALGAVVFGADVARA